MKRLTFLPVFLISMLVLSCQPSNDTLFLATFDDINDRVWIGNDYWSIPLEDWRVQDGRLECIGERPEMRTHVLTRVIGENPGSVKVSVRMGLLNESEINTGAGFRIGITDPEEDDYRAAMYFGEGINAGITTDQQLFIEESEVTLPEEFHYQDFRLEFSAEPAAAGYLLTLTATDRSEVTASLEHNVEEIHGLIALVNHFDRLEYYQDAPRFWFDDLEISGSKIQAIPDNAFGPILWAMYTLSREQVKLTAQMPPLGVRDNQMVQLQLKQGTAWETVDEQPVDRDARIATFRLVDWDASLDQPYRLVYRETNRNDRSRDFYFEGTIRRDPVDRPLVFGGLTCQYGTGFPYAPVVKNLTHQDPDLLYFSGDQIYEGNGGYGIIRFPADRSILNYLGKYYMFGWAFGDLMRDRPTVVTPDDHDVFQGNIWGEGGRPISMEQWNQYVGAVGGYVQPPEMVTVVHKTQCAHLPDPYDPAPIEQEIPIFYTDLIYGRVSFAIVTDRIFKSNPQDIAFWAGRADHVQVPLPDMSVLERPHLKILGDRQMTFLQDWVTDWRGADMKVLLSQTVFANIATHHGGNQMVLHADLDSGGWPKTARDRALRMIRKGFAFHIVGDQHLPSLSQYGVEDFRDAGWSFCTPAIYVGYERRFLPERLGLSITDPPDHGYSDTGLYRDPFGSLHYVYAVGNPVDRPAREPRLQHGQDKSSGYGLVRFDQVARTIEVSAFRYNTDVTSSESGQQFPGWPHTLHQLDNYGRQPAGYLPELRIQGIEKPVVIVTNEQTGEVVYALRLQTNEWTPFVFHTQAHSVRVGDPEQDIWQTMENLEVAPEPSGASLEIVFE